jgi:UDP-N-acetylglucosamine 4,6-dehydratase/5-epimerase
MSDFLTDKTLLITGGTGSFGKTMVKRLLRTKVKAIRIFSRDEKKQDDMRKKFNDIRLQFYLGDVRDRQSIDVAMKDVDYVFHAAALKQVPSCEFFPLEAVKTNILGAENVMESAINNGVKKLVCLSTDKAAYPINTMGMTKAIMEKIAIAKARNSNSTVICATRYGNVMGSRGSVIPHFIELINKNESLTLTDPTMTRFLMSLEDAIELVLFAFEHGESGEIYVKKSPAANIQSLADAIIEIYGNKTQKTKIIGIRHGEKLYETLITSEESRFATDMGDYYKISPDDRDLNYSLYFDKGNKFKSFEYNSNNAKQLSKDDLIKLISGLPINNE